MGAGAMPTRVLVLGARGYLGEHVVRQLAAAGTATVAAVRPGSGYGIASPHITVIEGDLADAGFLRRALDGVGAVIFAAGRTWQPGLAVAELYRQNVTITERFFGALAGRPGVRVVFTSSLSAVAGSRRPRAYAEDSGRAGVCERLLTPYDRAKIACEQVALDAARRGSDVVVLSPGLLLGPGATPTSNLAAAFLLLWFCQGQLAARFYVNGGVTLSDVRDVARAHVAALRRGRSGERYILGGHGVDRREFYDRLARLTGLRPPHRLPARLVSSLMAAADGLAFVTRGLCPSPVHRSFARAQRLYYYGESNRAAEALGYTTTPLEVTVLDMLRDYQARGLLPEALGFVKDLTPENAPAFVLLRQLVGRSAFSRFLLPRLSQVHEICTSNQDLGRALRRLLAASTFHARAGRFRWDRAACRHEVRTLRRFFEYVYFASDEFLREAL
jgi:nucleoside-diphosphate-sugar epimerase